MMTRSILIGILLSSTAAASDLNNDGCQDEYPASGSCVDVDATVDATSTVSANASILHGAWIGPNIAVGDGVVVGANAVLAGHSAHASPTLAIGAGTVIRRGAELAADHVLGSSVTIGRTVTTGERLTVANGATIGYASMVGDDVTIGTSAVVGNLVALGDFATLGDSAVIARGVTVASGATAGDGVLVNGVVGPDVDLAMGSSVEQGGRVRKQANIGENSTVETTGRVGRAATIEAGATVYGRVGTNAVVGAGATVEAGSTVARGGHVCAGTTLPTGSHVAIAGMWPLEGCPAEGDTCQAIKTANPSATDGIYTLDPDGVGGMEPFDTYCDMTRDGGGWTLVLQNNSGVTNPTPSWIQATTQVTTNGSTDAANTFDIVVGLDAWNDIGDEARYEVGGSPGNPSLKALYSSASVVTPGYSFVISGQTLPLGGATPGISLHSGLPLSTFDMDNDTHGTNCSASYGSQMWWYSDCWTGSIWGFGTSNGARWVGNYSATTYGWGALWIR